MCLHHEILLKGSAVVEHRVLLTSLQVVRQTVEVMMSYGSSRLPFSKAAKCCQFLAPVLRGFRFE